MGSPVNYPHALLRRVVAAGVPLLFVAGVVSAGAVPDDDGDEARDTVVAAAGLNSPLPVSEPTSAVVPETTTSTVPATTTTVAPATTTTRPRPTTTTAAAAPTTTAATATTVPATAATVTLVNQYGDAVVLQVNGRSYELAAGQRMANVSIVPAESGNDAIGVTWAAVPTCGIGDAMKYFEAGRRYTLTVFRGLGTCTVNNDKGPEFKVAAA